MSHSLVHHLRPALFFLCLTLIAPIIHAQSEDDDSSDLDQIEAEIGKSTKKVVPANPTNRPSGPVSDPQTLSDLGKLAPFSEVSVLQKRFMPKTERFQASYGLGGIMNDPWFNGLGGSLRLAYHFSENWGVEGLATFLSSSQKDAAKDLYGNNNVNTNSLVTTKGYYGVDLMWSPIYGKMSLYNKRIIPFDMYFVGGLGVSQVSGATAETAPTVHVGTGQIYSLSKSWGFRWDFSYNTYTATQVDPENGHQAAAQFNNLILTLGGSFFFPEATYR